MNANLFDACALASTFVPFVHAQKKRRVGAAGGEGGRKRGRGGYGGRTPRGKTFIVFFLDFVQKTYHNYFFTTQLKTNKQCFVFTRHFTPQKSLLLLYHTVYINKFMPLLYCTFHKAIIYYFVTIHFTQ